MNCGAPKKKPDGKSWPAGGDFYLRIGISVGRGLFFQNAAKPSSFDKAMSVPEDTDTNGRLENACCWLKNQLKSGLSRGFVDSQFFKQFNSRSLISFDAGQLDMTEPSHHIRQFGKLP